MCLIRNFDNNNYYMYTVNSSVIAICHFHIYLTETHTYLSFFQGIFTLCGASSRLQYHFLSDILHLSTPLIPENVSTMSVDFDLMNKYCSLISDLKKTHSNNDTGKLQV